MGKFFNTNNYLLATNKYLFTYLFSNVFLFKHYYYLSTEQFIIRNNWDIISRHLHYLKYCKLFRLDSGSPHTIIYFLGRRRKIMYVSLNFGLRKLDGALVPCYK